MKAATRFVAIILLIYAIPIQASNRRASINQSGSTTGTICIAPPAKPTSGEKSLYNSTGGNEVQVYSFKIDNNAVIKASNEKAVKITGLSLGQKHFVRILGDGKQVASFRFKFEQYNSSELCLWFNALYETWSLWEAKAGGKKCQCKTAGK